MNKIFTIASDACTLYVDINSYECPTTLFKSSRPNESNDEIYCSQPDTVIPGRNCIAVIKLTCLFEMNLLKSHDYKNTRYRNLHSALLNPCSHFKLMPTEIPCYWFHRIFNKNLNGKYLGSVRIIKECQKVTIRVSYYIYYRHKKI